MQLSVGTKANNKDLQIGVVRIVYFLKLHKTWKFKLPKINTQVSRLLSVNWSALSFQSTLHYLYIPNVFPKDYYTQRA